jgi:RNA polymerase sigma-70 factor (ECF subfamily)
MSEQVPNPTPISLLKQLRKTAEPSHAAWRRFAQLYMPLLFLWARRLGVESQEADDLVQDVFVILVRELPTFQHDGKQRFRGWLWTILLNKWRDRVRQQKVAPNLNAQNGLETVAIPDPAEVMVEDEYRSYLIERALEVMRTELSVRDHDACEQYLVQGRPAVEVARTLEMSVNQVYLAKSRFLRYVRSELEGLLD